MSASGSVRRNRAARVFPVIGPISHPPSCTRGEDWWQNRLPARAASRSPKIANGLIDPILARRAGINTLLLGSWDEIAGEQFAGCSRP
jgi:hypothetical protein